jgi:hypothetical protein
MIPLNRFLGICPWDRSPLYIGKHETDSKVPSHHVINSTSLAKLKEFFRPFNILLDDLINDKFGYD